MSAVLQETCPRCGIQRPWHCDCEDMFDVNSGRATITVAGMGTVKATLDDAPQKPTIYELDLKIRDDENHLAFDLRMSLDDALRFAEKVRAQVEELKRD